MNPTLRSIAAVLLGLVVAVVITASAEIINSRIHPLPDGVDPMDLNALRSVIQTLPATAFLLVLVGWAVATFSGAWVAARLAPQSPLKHGTLVAVFLFGMGLLNMLILPHPLWFWILALAAFVGGGYAGSKLGAMKKGSRA